MGSKQPSTLFQHPQPGVRKYRFEFHYAWDASLSSSMQARYMSCGMGPRILQYKCLHPELFEYFEY